MPPPLVLLVVFQALQARVLAATFSFTLLSHPLIFFLRFMPIFLRGGEKSTSIYFVSDVMIHKKRPSLLSSCSAVSSKTPRIPSKLEGIRKDHQIQLLAPCSITQKSDPMSDSGSCSICCYPRPPDSFQYNCSPASHPQVCMNS